MEKYIHGSFHTSLLSVHRLGKWSTAYATELRFLDTRASLDRWTSLLYLPHVGVERGRQVFLAWSVSVEANLLLLKLSLVSRLEYSKSVDLQSLCSY